MFRRAFLHDTSLVSALSFISGAFVRLDRHSVISKHVDLVEMTIGELHEGYQSKQFTILDVVRSYLDRIQRIDDSGPMLNSVISLNPKALEQAETLDQELQDGKGRGRMHGVPVILKDNIDTKDIPTTAGSRALDGSYPLKDSHVTRQLIEAGAVILGKANLSEWANFRGRNSTSGWSGMGGLTKNPYVLDRNACGSSSGSGASVSANLCMVAIGTETNGSIVCPSNANGVVGIKPTVGLISRSGIIPISWTQDTAGPMARTLTDATICLNVLTKTDSLDAKTLQAGRKTFNDYTQFLDPDGLRGKKLGYYTQSRGRLNSVDRLMDQALEVIRGRGAEIIEIESIAAPSAGSDSFQIMLYEYKDGLNKYFASLGDKAQIKNLQELIEFNRKDSLELEHFGQEFLEMALDKEGLDSEDYRDTLERMLKASREDGIDAVMNEHALDAFIAPTGSPAWKSDLVVGDNFSLGSSSPAARAGYPNITVPMGFIKELPVGLSFFGKAWSESTLLSAAYDFEQSTNYRRTPKFLKS